MCCRYQAVVASITWREASPSFTESQIVPVYQAFGGGGYAAWILPTSAQISAADTTLPGAQNVNLTKPLGGLEGKGQKPSVARYFD
jgi:hypothetical protein